MSKPLYTEVHSPHVLSLNDRVALETLKKNPDDYVGINFAMSAMGFVDVGTHFVFFVQVPFGKGIFPDLNRPTILGPQGQQQVPKTFDHGLGIPPYFRMLVRPSVLDRPIRRAIEEMIALEGMSLDDPDVRRRWDKAQKPTPDNGPARAPTVGDIGGGLAGAAAAGAKVGEEARVASVDAIEASLNAALGNDGPDDSGEH